MTNHLLSCSTQSTFLPSLWVNDLASIVHTIELKNGPGINREKRKTCITGAGSDYEAFQAWLNKYANKSALTQKQYKREVERLFIWALSERKKVISDFTVEDFQSYLQFIANPQPAAIWIMKPSIKTGYGSQDWRPFTGPLSHTSKARTFTILHSLLEFWVNIGYASLNPMNALAGFYNNTDKHTQTLTTQARILEEEEWLALLQVLQDLPENSRHQIQEKMRLKLIVMILFCLGLRINELVTHTWGAFQKNRDKWWFYVTGKGGKQGKIPVHHALMEEISAFRRYFTMPPEPDPFDSTPIIPNWRSENTLGARQINKMLKALAVTAAENYFPNKPAVQEKLKHFSAHWIRHISASAQEREGIDLKFIISMLRHSKEETTRMYIHSDDEQRHDAIQKLKWRD